MGSTSGLHFALERELVGLSRVTQQKGLSFLGAGGLREGSRVDFV